jgi:hypothetical protein
MRTARELRHFPQTGRQKRLFWSLRCNTGTTANRARFVAACVGRWYDGSCADLNHLAVDCGSTLGIALTLEYSNVSRRLKLVAILLCSLATAAPRAEALTVYAQLFPLTGEVRLLNKDAVPFPFIFYSISANANALNPASNIWRSITANYDAPFGGTPGNGFIDATGEWAMISATSSQLTEGSLDDPGGVLLANRAISLGRIWNPALDPQPTFSVLEPNGLSATVNREFALDGDYLPNGTVDATDYALWRQFYGSTAVLLADGNINGIIDTVDYVVWRDNLGKTLNGTGFSAGPLGGSGASSFIGQVPEPTTAFLMIASAGFLLTMRRTLRVRPTVRN